jgi:hypothetical protein
LRSRELTVIVVPEGNHADPTRAAEHDDPVYRYLRDVGVPQLA